MKIKKMAKVKIIATPEKCRIEFPKQNIGNIASFLLTRSGTDFSSGKPVAKYEEKLIRQWELVLEGDDLKVKRIV